MQVKAVGDTIRQVMCSYVAAAEFAFPKGQPAYSNTPFTSSVSEIFLTSP
jgi:hypothetical protein